MNSTSRDPGSWAERTRQNRTRLKIWTGAWLVSLAVAAFGPLLVWEAKAVTAAAVLINLGVGAGMIVANKVHLRGLDELQQRIQLEAMALALGVALVVGLAYSTADVTDLIPYRAEISNLVFLIGLTYGAAVIIGRGKYR